MAWAAPWPWPTPVRGRTSPSWPAPPSELEAVAVEIRALGRHAHTVEADLITSEGAYRAATETIRELGKVDILVNNAGGYRLFTSELTHAVTVLDITEEEWRRVMESNLTTTFMTCKAVLPHMIECRRGRGHQPDFKERCPPGPGPDKPLTERPRRLWSG